MSNGGEGQVLSRTYWNADMVKIVFGVQVPQDWGGGVGFLRSPIKACSMFVSNTLRWNLYSSAANPTINIQTILKWWEMLHTQQYVMQYLSMKLKCKDTQGIPSFYNRWLVQENCGHDTKAWWCHKSRNSHLGPVSKSWTPFFPSVYL